jgi:hypothetical protein
MIMVFSNIGLRAVRKLFRGFVIIGVMQKKGARNMPVLRWFMRITGSA